MKLTRRHRLHQSPRASESDPSMRARSFRPDRPRRQRMLALVCATGFALTGLVAVSAPAHAQACTPGTDSDFDGDGVADLAIGDPDATVNGQVRAGWVHIAYGDGGTQTITQNHIPDNDNGAGERFGFAMATTDWNGDGCTDLFIGAPFEKWSNNTVAEAGVVVFIPGSSAGLDTANAETWAQNSLGGWANEAGDRFGWSLAAGTSIDGMPFLVAGSPGEGVNAGEQSGMVLYITPTWAKAVHQDTDGVPGDSETGDLYGYAVAASASGFAIGGPGEGLDGHAYVGTVHLFAHAESEATPPLIVAWDQGTDGISGARENGDMYGFSLDMVDYTPTTGTSCG